MATYNGKACRLDITIEAGTQSIAFTFNNGTLNVTGTWKFVVRDTFASTTIKLAPTVDVTSAASGVVRVPLTEAQCLGLIPTDLDRYVGVYTLEKDTLPWFDGTFTVEQKASRA